MTGFEHLESPLDEAPLFFVEDRDNDPRPEIERQAEFKADARRDGFKVAAVPNARKWGMKAWNLAKKEGVVWGYPDLIVTGSRRFTAFVEMKDGKATPDQHQVDVLNGLYRQGFPVAVLRTSERGMPWLRSAYAAWLSELGLAA